MIPHEVLICAEYARGLHRSSLLRAQDALDHDATAHVESPAIVANPIVVRNLIDAVAPLMNRDVASSTKDNQVLILIIPIIADGTLCVFLHNEASLVRAQ